MKKWNSILATAVAVSAMFTFSMLSVSAISEEVSIDGTTITLPCPVTENSIKTCACEKHVVLSDADGLLYTGVVRKETFSHIVVVLEEDVTPEEFKRSVDAIPTSSSKGSVETETGLILNYPDNCRLLDLRDQTLYFKSGVEIPVNDLEQLDGENYCMVSLANQIPPASLYAVDGVKAVYTTKGTTRSKEAVGYDGTIQKFRLRCEEEIPAEWFTEHGITNIETVNFSYPLLSKGQIFTIRPTEELSPFAVMKIILDSGEETIDYVEPFSENPYLSQYTSFGGLTLVENTNTEMHYLIGDVNADGSVDLSDAVAISKNVAGMMQLSPYGSVCADCNGDGRIDENDTALMLQFLVHLIMKFPAAA